MEFAIQNKGIKELTNYLIATDNTTIQEFLGVENLDELDVCEYLAHWLDERLEDYFDTFVCLNHASWSRDKDWKIEATGIRELTEYLNTLTNDDRYEISLEDVTEEYDVNELDVCKWIEKQIDDICEKTVSYEEITKYISYR